MADGNELHITVKSRPKLRSRSLVTCCAPKRLSPYLITRERAVGLVTRCSLRLHGVRRSRLPFVFLLPCRSCRSPTAASWQASIPDARLVIIDDGHLRAARMLAGLTQADLARAAGCHPRSVRYWENKGSNPPTNVASTLDSIERALNRHGVIPFSTPTPGVRCSN